MRPMRRAGLGVLLLCAVASLAACKSSGGTQHVVVDPTVVEVPRRQLVRVSGELTNVPDLPPAPTPAVPAGPSCDRGGGCFSNRQLESMLTLALDWGGRMADQLVTIRDLMSESLQPKGNTHDQDRAAPVPGRGAQPEDR